MSNKQSRRDDLGSRNKRRRLNSILIWAGLGVALLVVLAFVVFQGISASERGVAVQLPPDSSHIPIGTPPGPYISDPPTGGRHYPFTFKAGFYEESDLTSLPQYPEGYLVHNEEHGYVIFWYNCDSLSTIDCENLKANIRKVMDEFGGTKLIAFPMEVT